MKEVRRATCSRIKTTIPLLSSIAYTTEHKSEKKKLFGKFSVLQKKSVSIVFETYFPLNVFTARHIFQ